jgi:hypothetical protein
VEPEAHQPRTRCRDLPEKLTLSTSKREKEKLLRKKKRDEKIERIAERLEGGTRAGNIELQDQIEEWVNDDFEQMEINEDDEREFLNGLSGDYDIPIQKTGARWYHHQYGVGRFFKSIREGNNEHNRTTILIIRGGDKSIYRLGIPTGEEFRVLSTAISKGYILSEVKISHVDK